MIKNHRILITGSNGLLGQKLVALLSDIKKIALLGTSRGENRIEGVYNFDYLSMDICNANNILEVFEKFNPTAVINTAAYTQVDDCEDNPEDCRILNVEGVRNLVNACLKFKSKLIHLSTDFVFDGLKGNYAETDEPNPLSEYAKSKLEAEILIQNSGLQDWAIARTIIIYGVTHKMSRSNLVLWAVNSLTAGKNINVVDDQFRAPTLAEDLAYACYQMIEKNVQGMYHLSGPETFSVHELVVQVAEKFELDANLIGRTSSADLNQKANRPPKTGFDISKARRDFGYNPKTFMDGLEVVQIQLSEVS